MYKITTNCRLKDDITIPTILLNLESELCKYEAGIKQQQSDEMIVEDEGEEDNADGKVTAVANKIKVSSGNSIPVTTETTNAIYLFAIT